MASNHNVSQPSLFMYHDPELKGKRASISKILEICFHRYRTEHLTRNQWLNRLNSMGFDKKITYKQAQPRFADLIIKGVIHKTGNTVNENNIRVETLAYGSSFLAIKTYHQIYVEEVEKTVDVETAIAIKPEAERLFKYNRKRN